MVMKAYTNAETASWEPEYDSIVDKFETDRNLERTVICALQELSLIHI